MNKKIIFALIALIAVILVIVFVFPQNKKEKVEIPNKIETPLKPEKAEEEKPEAILKPEVQVEVKKSSVTDKWAEISKKIALVEEEINSENFNSLENLKELLINNPEYPNKKIVEEAIKNWEQEKTWASVGKQILSLEKELNSGNYKRLEIVKELMLQNPTYPMKTHIEESIKRWEQGIIWEALSKQVEMMEFMLDKGIYSELETIKDLMNKNPLYPKKPHYDKRIKYWEHEVFLINVPL